MEKVNRKLGYTLAFPETKLEDLIAKKDEILKAITEHGVVCLKNVDFTPHDMVALTKALAKEVIQLPPEMTFNNQDPVYTQVCRVGNINVDGTLKESYYDANYWHQDGDFWRPKDRLILNFLHTRELPDTDGNTEFLDLVKAFKYLQEHEPQLLEEMRRCLGKINVFEIIDFKALKNRTDLGVDCDVETDHKMVNKSKLNGQDVVYLSWTRAWEALADGTIKQRPDIDSHQIISLLVEKMGIYSHKWQKGDLLIWDNTQVMHKSQGKFTGRRLLLRSQGRLDELDE